LAGLVPTKTLKNPKNKCRFSIATYVIPKRQWIKKQNVCIQFAHLYLSFVQIFNSFNDKPEFMIQIYNLNTVESPHLVPLVLSPISAGFPSPATDYLEEGIDLNKEVVKNPDSTFIAKVVGVSMIDAGFYPGDIIVVDKSLNAKNNDIAVCSIDGEFTLKRIKIEHDRVFLQPENKRFSPIFITPENDFLVWGIVTYLIKKTR
jgi:DNA polymerase V